MGNEHDREILELVRERLQRTNPPSTEAFYDRAAWIDESIRELTFHQFNARYPLSVWREMAWKETGEKKKRTSSDVSARRDIRIAVLDFARDGAETPPGPTLVDLVGEGAGE